MQPLARQWNLMHNHHITYHFFIVPLKFSQILLCIITPKQTYFLNKHHENGGGFQIHILLLKIRQALNLTQRAGWLISSSKSELLAKSLLIYPKTSKD
jgi:hypothetical protein